MSTVPNATPGSGSTSDDHGFFGHPRGLSTLFFTEMWERFSYYGMRALLTLYMTSKVINGGLGFSEAYSGAIYATYVSSVWYLPLVGGWLADKVLGARRAVLIGGIIIEYVNLGIRQFRMKICDDLCNCRLLVITRNNDGHLGTS